MRKHGKVWLTLLCVTLCLLALLCACGDQNQGKDKDDNEESDFCEHSWEEQGVITSPSCIRVGTMAVKCAKCGESSTKSIDALEHAFSETPTSATPATCTKNGTEQYACTRCGKTKTITIDALGHAYDEEDADILPATCTSAGRVRYTCIRCDGVNTDVINALGHSFTNYTVTAATCTADSYKSAKCDRCDEVDVVTNKNTALGHKYGEDGKCTKCFTLDPALKVSSLEISNDTFLLEAGKSTQVKFAVYPANAIYEKVTYRIFQNNTCEAMLTDTGLLTCGKVGSVTVAVTIDDEITARATFYVPQMITTPEAFFNIRNDLSGIYMLANDIDLSGYANWTPIGNATKNSSGNYDYTNAFSGKFDGGGHTISGVNINLSDSSCSSLLTVGLFGSLSRDGQISNVVLRDVKITGTGNATDYVGMLVGFNPGSVSGCDVSGTMTVSGATYVGGVIGENIGSAEKISSDVSITVSGSKRYLVGGITGRTNGGQLSDVSVKGSINVTSSASVYVGGVAGNLVDKLTTASADMDIKVKTTSSSSSYNYVGVIAGASTQSLADITVDGSVTVESYANVYAGGIVGYSEAAISKCVSNAVIAVTVTNSSSTSSYVGGVIGCTAKSIEECTSNGNLRVTQFYGGFVGGIAGSCGAVSKCENNAPVYVTSNSRAVYCGGVAGSASSATASSNSAKTEAYIYANYIGGVIGYSEGAVSGCVNHEKGELVVGYSNSASSTSSQYIGGVVGYGKSTVSESANYANVSAASNGVVYVGGVLGYAYGNVADVNNYGYSLTVTSGSTSSSYSNYVGGVAGYVAGTLSTAYNTAVVDVTKGNVAVGGVAGYVDGAVKSAKSTANVTVNNTVSGQSVKTYVGGVIGNAASSVTGSTATGGSIKVSSRNKVYVGGVVGICDATVTECYAYPDIEVSNSYEAYLGGVSGSARKIVKSYATSNVSGDTLGSYDLYMGGLSGYVSGGAEQSYASGDVCGTSSSAVYAGGLVGSVGSSATVTGCYTTNGYVRTNSSAVSSSSSVLIYNGGLVGYNQGTISYSYAVSYGYSISYGSSNSHSHYIGGLVAYNGGTVSSSYVLDATDMLARSGLEINRDVVGSGAAKSFYAGGFVGYNKGTVTNCYTNATVNTTVSGAYTGGFVGFNDATVKNSIAYGEVNSGIAGDTTGGFAGGGASGYTSCFFSKDTTLQATAVGSAAQSGIAASTNAGLRAAATFSGFSTTYWNIIDGTYPTLKLGSTWENRSDGFNTYNMLVNVPNKGDQYQFPHGNRVAISFEHDGEEATAPIVATKGETVALPTLPNYVQGGVTYIFSGWCTDAECLQAVEGTLLKVTAPQKLYAYYRQAVEKPSTVTHTYTGSLISVADVYKTNDAYTVSGVLEGTVAGEYKVVLQLTHWYCWSDGTADAYEIVWRITPFVVTVPDIYVQGSNRYVMYAGEARELAAEHGSELYTVSGDTAVSGFDLDEHSIKFALKDTKNYVWSDGTAGEKAFAYYVATGVCNAADSTVAYWLADGTLTVIGEGAMASYSLGTAPWYSRREEIARVVVMDGVTSIGEDAFYNCASLTSVTFAEGSALTSIGSYAFYDCDSLTSVTIPASVTSIGTNAFWGCSKLTSVTFAEGSKLTSIGDWAFYDCTSLTSVTFAEGSALTSIGYAAFSSCGSLTSITIPAGVTYIGGGAFWRCYKLIEVYNCSALNITVRSYDNGEIGYYAKNVYTPTSGTSKLTTTADGYIFYIDGDTRYLLGKTDAKQATTLTLPANCNGSTYEIYERAFQDCDNLTSINIPSSVTSIGNFAFYSCDSLASVTFAEGSQLTSIGSWAFYGCDSLTSITIPASVTSISDYAFYCCSSLASIEIPASVTSIGEDAFNDCDSLTSVTFANPDGWWVSRDSEAISGTSVDVSDPTTAATLLTSTYYRYYWKRS